MFDNVKLPRWLGWSALGVAGLYFLAKVGLSVAWLLKVQGTDRYEPSMELIDYGFVILMAIAGISLRQTGEFGRIARIMDKRIRGHVTREHEQTREVIRSSQLQREFEYRESQQMIADRNLLWDLWQFINWRDLNDIVDQIHYGAGDYEFYKEKILAYLYFREENSERQLHTTELSQALSEFDMALHKFDRQLSTYADAEPQGDRWIWFPHYKYRLSQELYEYKHREYRKAVDYGIEMLDKHKVLVTIIRSRFPDFFES
jgi:hypothetical protein